jgi:glycosyltransferase involved in cell wall biosynthesis
VRILVASDQWFPDLMGGVARIATEAARRWAGAGHEVVVLAPRHPGHSEEERMDGGPTVHRVLPRGRLPRTVTDPLVTRRHARRFGQGSFDVLVGHTCTTAWGLLAARLGAPLVDVFHADAAAESRHLRSVETSVRRRLTALALERPLGRLERVTVRDAAAVVVLSEFSRGLVRDLDPEAAGRAVLAPGGVDTDAFTPDGRDQARADLGVDPSTRLVFTARRLVPRMGLEVLLDAVAALGDVQGLRVAIAGCGSLAGELEARRDALGLAGRVRLLGRVSDDDLRLWHRAADVFVLPTVAYEGFGLVTIEALASGTPVVGTPVGATPELLEPLEPRLVARGADASALAEALQVGLELASPALRQRCREHAVLRYSWDAVLPAWEHALHVAVDSAGDRAGAAPTRRSAVAADGSHD